MMSQIMLMVDSEDYKFIKNLTNIERPMHEKFEKYGA